MHKNGQICQKCSINCGIEGNTSNENITKYKNLCGVKSISNSVQELARYRIVALISIGQLCIGYFYWNPEVIYAHLVIDVCVVFCPRFQLLHPLYLRLALTQVCLYPNVFLLGQFSHPSHQLSGAGRGESRRKDGLYCGALHGLDARYEFPCPPQRIRGRFRVEVWRVPATG